MPKFIVDMESSIAPVWVSLPQLPDHFFSKSSLFSLRSLVGKPMKIDVVTATVDRPSVARVCVEMDLVKKFPLRVWIGSGFSGYWQNVVYEKVPSYCTKCYKQGHSNSSCKMGETQRG